VQLEAGDLAGAQIAFGSAIERCTAIDIVQRGPLLRLLAVCRYDAGRLDEAAELLSEAIEHLTAVGSREELTEALGLMGRVQLQLGEPASAAGTLGRVVAVSREAGDAAELTESLVDFAGALLAAGNDSDAVEALTEALPMVRGAGADERVSRFEALILAGLAVASTGLGATIEADRYAAEARAAPVGPEFAEVVDQWLGSLPTSQRSRRRGRS
jgi:tetratricopeptide (TPR) repeat protein